jgi:L-amino acid N-acyltransferase YncA
MDIAVRRLASGDMTEVFAIFEPIAKDGSTYVHDESTTDGAFAEYWTGRGGEQWVASVDGRIVGSYTLRPNHPGRGAHVATASYIVAESARGKGVGLALGTHSLERARALGFVAMQFNCVVSTNEAAVRLWKRLGFETVGSLPGAFRLRGGRDVDAYVMFRRL